MVRACRFGLRSPKTSFVAARPQSLPQQSTVNDSTSSTRRQSQLRVMSSIRRPAAVLPRTDPSQRRRVLRTLRRQQATGHWEARTDRLFKGNQSGARLASQGYGKHVHSQLGDERQRQLPAGSSTQPLAEARRAGQPCQRGLSPYHCSHALPAAAPLLLASRRRRRRRRRRHVAALAPHPRDRPTCERCAVHAAPSVATLPPDNHHNPTAARTCAPCRPRRRGVAALTPHHRDRHVHARRDATRREEAPRLDPARAPHPFHARSRRGCAA